MKFITLLVALSTFALHTLALSNGVVRVTYDNTYDNPKASLFNTACSNGENGLLKKYPTLDQIPNFPFVGGMPGLTWNSPDCGSCWELKYTKGTTTRTIYVTAVDGSWSFNLAQKAMDALTGGLAVDKGAVDAVATRVDAKKCGM